MPATNHAGGIAGGIRDILLVQIQPVPGVIEILPCSLGETADPLPPASPVRIHLGRGEEGSRSEGWDVPGRVVRIESASGPRSGFRIGVAFDRLVPEECLAAQAEGARRPAARAGRGGAR